MLYCHAGWLVNCTCTNGQGPPPAAKRPGCGDPDGARSGGFEAPAIPAAGSGLAAGDSFRLCADCGPFWEVSVRAGEDAWEGDSVQCCAAHPEKRCAIRIARLGRKLPGEWGMGRAFGFADQSESQD